MGLWFWKRKAEANPLRAYDDALELLAKRADEVRRAAATLLVLRTDLERQVARHGGQVNDAKERGERALSSGDARAAKTLAQDEEDSRRLLRAAEASLARTEVDAALLTEAGGELREQLVRLRAERIEAGTQLRAGQAAKALGRLTANADWALSLELDKARDEVEQAHALAEGYRAAHEPKR